MVAERKDDLNARLEEWKSALENNGLRISRSKTEYLWCNFSRTNDEEDEVSLVTIGGQEVPQTTRFKYLGYFVQNDGDIDCDVAHRGKFYRVAVRPAMLYGIDCWPIKKIHERKLEAAEMRMLRWMCGHTRLDRIRNETIRGRVGVTCISDKVREGRLRWFGHVRRRHVLAPVRRVENLSVEGKRYRGRPRLTWEKQIRQDMIALYLSEDMISDRNSWRRRIKARDY
ncbi:hypothetical protein E3N88_07098 [Mikania micrantha]|uniref:Reverse transcriptase domain-containing protein n=1 Tax=Mikania micrantha TaxID=192012 RepID=A0A5N6PRL6_9ASTR|nr:hypothetical protein E3N88_07098 [Mikania micrantha]